MGWMIASCLVIGAVCALRVPILVFALFVLAAVVAIFAFEFANGMSAWNSIGLAVLFAVFLEAGYVAGYVLLHFYFSRQRKRLGEASTDSARDDDVTDRSVRDRSSRD
jgi:hypothetical protein